MISRVLSLLFCWSLTLGAASGAQASLRPSAHCGPLLQSLFGPYQDLRTDAIREVKNGTPSTSDWGRPDEREEIMAFLEKTGTDFGKDYAPLRHEKDILAMLSSFEQKNGLILDWAEDFLEKAYLLSEKKKPFTERYNLKAQVQRLTLREILKSQIDYEGLRRSFISKLAQNNYLRDPSRLEKAMSWFSKKGKRYISLSIATTFNIVLIPYLHTGYFPSIRATYIAEKLKKLPQPLLDRIQVDGFDAVYEELQAYFGWPAYFEVSWNHARTLFFQISRVAALTLFLQHPGMVALPLEEIGERIPVVSDQLNTYLNYVQNRDFNAQAFRHRQFELWKIAFEDFEGRPPDIKNLHNHPQDKEEADRVWNRLQNTPDDKLKFDFKKSHSSPF